MSGARRVVDAALGEERAWVVGGAVRDALLGREGADVDVDVVVDGDVEAAARAVARTAGRGSARFSLSDAFDTWRVVGPGQAWQVDVTPLRGGGIETDLALRDLTINAMAEPVGGGPLVDPFGGRADLAARVARAVAARAFADDPLRCLRVARLACELELRVDPATARLAGLQAPRLGAIAGERVFAELKRIVAAPGIRDGLRLMDELGVMAQVLPELTALRGVEQNRYHHADVLGHTLEVLDAELELEADPGRALGPEHADAIRALLCEPLADGLTRREGLRWGALLHDAAKPMTRAVGEHGQTLGFPRHDVEGERLVREVFTRLRTSERLRAHVAALTRHHLALGFLVHERTDAGLPRRELYRYLTRTEPVEVDVTLLSVADRLATRGHKADEAIGRHMALAREVIGEALRWRAGETRPVPLLRGDELARELGLDPGPRIGRVLAQLAEARFAGEVRDRQDALRVARAFVGSGDG